jgi:hypothetical protein
MSRVKKKATRVPPLVVSDGGPNLSAEVSGATVSAAEVRRTEVPAAEVRGAKVSMAATPLDQAGGKEKLLEHVMTPNSKNKPPLPMPKKRKPAPEELMKSVRRRQHSSPGCRRSGRLEPSASNEGVHIHLSLDGSNNRQNQQVLASPKKITVSVSPGKPPRRLRRFLEVTTLAETLPPIAEGSGAVEEPARHQHSVPNYVDNHPSAGEDDCDADGEVDGEADREGDGGAESPMGGRFGSELGRFCSELGVGGNAPALGPVGNGPSTPAACNTVELGRGPP